VTPEIQAWPKSVRELLRAAVKNRYGEKAKPLLEELPIEWAPKRSVEIPSEEEAKAYEEAAAKLEPGRHALALLPLAVGLRANELVSLPRSAVERAAKQGELLVLRKGGKEQRLPVKHATKLFAELLTVPAGASRALTNPLNVTGKRWVTAGGILSGGEPIAQYHQLHKLIKATGDAAGLEDLRPHRLRHCFATRMARDGAPLQVIQWYLGHANLATTMIYVHTQGNDAEAFLRQV
jgi:integrase/recombinase XerD